MPIQTWMIYGAYGYSAGLIAQLARERGLNPVLAGRNADKTRAVADDLGFEHRAFALDDPETVATNLRDIDAVIHCAGPFSATSAAMLDACLASRTHYFDITGEIDVFENAHSKRIDGAARQAGIVVCPGIGFDVVPTDCIARALADALPDASDLALGFQGDMNVSPGTAKTIVERLGDGTFARRDGKLVNIPIELRDVDYGRGPRQSMCVSWGDVSTAYYTTGIGNISVYWPANDRTVRQFRSAAMLRPLLRLGWVQSLLKKQIEKRVQGPSLEQRDSRSVYVWGEVRNAAGQTVSARMTTANGYTVTQLAPIAIIEHLLANDAEPGSTTPALLMGKGFASSLDGSSEITTTVSRSSD
jgi:short subunit dehydrogenase-like uncharacterized protein